MKYLIENQKTKERLTVSLDWILKNINEDRTDEWTDYNETDWKEGLEEFTEFKLVKEVRT